MTAFCILSLSLFRQGCPGVARPLRFQPPQLESKEWADVAQLVEQPIRNRQVTSSSLVVGSIFLLGVLPIQILDFLVNAKGSRIRLAFCR